MNWRKVAFWTLAVVLLFASLGWIYRVEIILKTPGILQAILNPIAPNREVVWQQGPSAPLVPDPDRPPNIVLILADDMGFNDISFYNGGAADGSLLTPAIDRLAREGVAFANGYAGSAICAISRAALMTGRYSTRFGFEFTPVPGAFMPMVKMVGESLSGNKLRTTIWNEEIMDIEMPYAEQGLPTEEVTLAEVLKERGYHTIHIGKWHLGGANGMSPNDQGFDESLLMASGKYLPDNDPNVVNAKISFDPIDHFLWASMRYATSYNGGETFEPKGYLTDYYTDEAVKAITANRNQPFFLYLGHWGIHTPLQAAKSDYDKLDHIEDHTLRVYAAMIMALDRSVERIMAALQENGLDDNTLVIFTSDNGGAGYIGLPDINQPYRGWKLTFFEGGTHIPYFMRWPGKIPAGSVYEPPVSHLDVFATAVAAASARLPQDTVMDSVNLLPFITGEVQGVPHETLIWRQGDYQTVLHLGWKMQVSVIPDETWLFNLTDDPTEQADIAADHPDVVAELKSILAAHNAEQAEPAWPSRMMGHVNIDKTLADPQAEDDVYIYWPN